MPYAPGSITPQHRAHRQQAVFRVAGEDVRPAGAVFVQQAASVRMPTLQLGGVPGMVRDDRSVKLFLPPAKCRPIVAVAVQQTGLASTRLR
jgi:hypothetical protein